MTPKPNRTPVGPPPDPRVIPAFVNVPAPLEAPAEKARVALNRSRDASHAVNAASKALGYADNVDRAAAANALPGEMPQPTKPVRQREYDESIRFARAADDALKIATREQSDAIRPLVDDWRQVQEQQVAEVVQQAGSHLDAFLSTMSELDVHLALDDALREYDPDARQGWHLEWRDGDALRRRVDKAEATYRNSGLAHDHVPNTVHHLVAMLRIYADAWTLARDRRRKLSRRDELLAQFEAEGGPEHVVREKLRAAIRAEGLELPEKPGPR